MYNKDFMGKYLCKMFKPEVLEDIAATLPDTPEAKEGSGCRNFNDF